MQYRQFEEALVQMFGIDDANLGAFRARLRHLRTLGIPDVPKRGSGNSVLYRSEEVFLTFVALVLQSLGSAPSVAVLIASITAKYLPRLKSGENNLFLVVARVPDSVLDTPGYMPGVQGISWINNSFGGPTFTCVVAGSAEAGKVVTHVKTIAAIIINLSERFAALPSEG
jgi:hypothetical protein